jgi:hypothetical protein
MQKSAAQGGVVLILLVTKCGVKHIWKAAKQLSTSDLKLLVAAKEKAEAEAAVAAAAAPAVAPAAAAEGPFASSVVELR